MQTKLPNVEIQILLLCAQESHGRILSQKGCKVLCIKKKKLIHLLLSREIVWKEKCNR